MSDPTIPPEGLSLGGTYSTPQGVYIKIAMGQGVPVTPNVNLPVAGLNPLATALMFPSPLSRYL